MFTRATPIRAVVIAPDQETAINELMETRTRHKKTPTIIRIDMSIPSAITGNRRYDIYYLMRHGKEREKSIPAHVIIGSTGRCGYCERAIPIKHGRRFCNSYCSNAFRRYGVRASERKCAICGRVLPKHKSKWCSAKCGAMGRKEAKT